MMMHDHCTLEEEDADCSGSCLSSLPRQWQSTISAIISVPIPVQYRYNSYSIFYNYKYHRPQYCQQSIIINSFLKLKVISINEIHVAYIFSFRVITVSFKMGNEAIIHEKGMLNAEKVGTIELTHLGTTTLLRWQEKQCLLKIFSFSDSFLMEQCLRRLKTRASKLSNSPHVLAVYQVSKQQKKELCANNYQLHVYLEYFDSTLAQVIQRHLQQRRNFTEEELYAFLSKVVDSLIYIQDNGLKNIQLDVEAVLFSGDQIKVLDNSVACSKTYYRLLDQREKGIENSENRVYLAPQLLKDLKELNYDPYISPKADIFSLGMLLLQMVTLEPMRGYYDYHRANMDYDSLIHRLSRISHSLPLKTLLAEMLQHDPEERIGLVSLREKLQKLKNSSAQRPSIARSRSTKMLKEILSHSRRSGSASKQAEGTSRPQSCDGKSFEVSRRQSDQSSIKQTQKDNSNKQTSNNNTLQKDLSKKDSRGVEQHLQNNLGSAEFKNLVKNRLFKEKNKENPNKSVVEGGNTKLSSYYTGVKPLKDLSKIGVSMQTRVLLERNSKLESSRNRKFESNRTQHFQYNKYQSNRNHQFESSEGSNRLEQSLGAKGSLCKLVEESGMKSLLRLEQLDINNLNRGKEQTAKNTSRFGIHQYANYQTNIVEHDSHNISSESFIPLPREKTSTQIYLKQSRSKQLQNQLQDQIPSRKQLAQQSGRERKLNKVMTFNTKQFFINAKSVQESLEIEKGANQDQKLVFSPIQSTHREKPNASVYKYDSCEVQDSPQTITIMNIPVVVSQEKTFMTGQNTNKNYGRLQRQLDMIECVQSIEQDSPSDCSNFMNTSNVIETFKPNDSYRKQEKEQQGSCFLKKRKPKKPNLNIKIHDEEDIDKANFQQPAQSPYNNRSNDNFLTQSELKFKLEVPQSSRYVQRQSSNFNSNSVYAETNLNLNILQKSQDKEKTEKGEHKIPLPNGDLYIGQLSRDQKITGNGHLYSEGKLKYRGSFKDGQFHGFGHLFNLNHSALPVDYRHFDLSKPYWISYEGQFQNGLRNNFGTIFFPNIEKFTGNFKGDVVDGFGCFYAKSGVIVNGTWTQNRLQAAGR